MISIRERQFKHNPLTGRYTIHVDDWLIIIVHCTKEPLHLALIHKYKEEIIIAKYSKLQGTCPMKSSYESFQLNCRISFKSHLQTNLF